MQCDKPWNVQALVMTQWSTGHLTGPPAVRPAHPLSVLRGPPAVRPAHRLSISSAARAVTQCSGPYPSQGRRFRKACHFRGDGKDE